MGNFTFSEIIWIVVIILIVFGPQRLPEMARKVGAFVAKARDAVTALQQQVNAEYGDTIQPLKDARDDLKDVKRQLTDTAKSAARDIEETTQVKDVTREVREAGRGFTANPHGNSGSGTGEDPSAPEPLDSEPPPLPDAEESPAAEPPGDAP